MLSLINLKKIKKKKKKKNKIGGKRKKKKNYSWRITSPSKSPYCIKKN